MLRRIKQGDEDMLLLTRRIGQTIVISTPLGPVYVTVMSIDAGERVRLGIAANEEIVVHRSELYDKIGARPHERKKKEDGGKDQE